MSSTTAIYRVLPGEAGVDLVATGFTAAAGIDLIESGGETLLAVADEVAGTVWLVAPATGLKLQVATGLSGPVAVAFSDDPVEGKTGLYVAEPTRILRLPDPRLEFTVDVDQRILLSKSWDFDVYPSPEQSTDGEIAVQVRLNPVMDPAGKTAFFRLTDPGDPSGYILGATNGDNLPTTPAGDVTAQAPFDVNGYATATLSVDNRYSGNNYRVEASLAGGGDFRTLATSPVYTTWRRTYIEHDYMWRTGAWVIADAGAGQANPMRVYVSDASGFAVGDDVQILSGDSFDTANGEFGTVVAVGPGYVDVDTDFGTGQAGLRYFYGSASAAPPNDQAPYTFLARVAPGVFDSFPNTASLAVAFDDAFAEWSILPTSGFVPHWDLVPNYLVDPDYIDQRSPLFFNAPKDPQRPPVLNTVHLVSADDSVGTLGLSQPAENWTWIFTYRLATAFPTAPQAATESTTAHELAHQYDVNFPDIEGHDTEDAWTPTGQFCLMNKSRDRTLGVVKMHAPAGAVTQDLICIRTHVDDLDNSSLCSQ